MNMLHPSCCIIGEGVKRVHLTSNGSAEDLEEVSDKVFMCVGRGLCIAGYIHKTYSRMRKLS